MVESEAGIWAIDVIAAGEEVTAAVRNFYRQEDLAARAISGERNG